MPPRKPSKGPTPDQPAATPERGPTPLEKIITRLAADLPLFDRKRLEDAVEEARQRPRASRQYLFERFTSGDPATRAIAMRVLAEIGGPDVVDNLNALVFDLGQDAYAKVLANSLLAQLGSAVDPDVFAMSVPRAEELERKLPARALQLLKDGNVSGAVEYARTLHPAERWLVMHAAAAQEKDRALPFLEALARDDEANATAAATAVAGEKLAGGPALLLKLQQTSGREFQKLVKKLLFDLRKAGVPVPDEKPRALEPAAAEVPDHDLPLYRAVASEPTPNGLILVTIARTKPNGRLKVFSVMVDLWKRGIQQAGLRLDMSKSSFDRFLELQSGSKLRMKAASIAECRKIVARGVRVAKEFGSPLSFDFGVGRPLLGDLDADIAAIENPFFCPQCAKPLDAEAIEKIKAVAPYEQIVPETRCKECRTSPGST